jgi:hypothetical protein
MTCMALVPGRGPAAAPDLSAEDGYQPAALREAYGLTSAAGSAGSGETVAVVDSFNDKAAASDLSQYRSEFGLPACGLSSRCLKIVNQAGGAALPARDPSGSWELEESTDLDMVSAICPNCAILLVEAKSDNISDLATAERYAASHANVVSNSWGSGSEFIGENAFDADFNHPRVPIVAAAGDDGYGTQYPAASQFVTAVGGTTLTGATSSAAGSQQTWAGTGSGCSSLEPKPAWQTADDRSPAGCENRTETDLSADANPETGVAVYDSFGGGWLRVGGTSVATVIVASAYALAGDPPGAYPASYPYLDRTGLRDVTTGMPNGRCEPDRLYLCQPRPGFDGPTGLGAPDGTGSFAGPVGGQVTVTDPGTRDYQAGKPVRLQIQARASAGGPIRYAARGLPAGLRLGRADGLISGRLTGRPGTHRVRVTVTGPGHGQGLARFTIVAVHPITARYLGSGQVRLDPGGQCLTGAPGRGPGGAMIEISACARGRGQLWQYLPGSAPGQAGRLRSHGACLTVSRGAGNGARAALRRCTGSAGQQWAYQSLDQLVNPRSGKCLDDPARSRKDGTQVVLWSCTGSPGESWLLPPGPVLSGLAGRCLTDPHDSASAGTGIQITRCDGSAGQDWVLKRSGRLQIRGRCLSPAGGSSLDDARIELARCSGSVSQDWLPGPGGELLDAGSGRCLAGPANRAASGSRLAQQDCYGEPGEIWAVG